MNILRGGLLWLVDSQNWWGSNGIVARMWEHVQISFLAVLLAALIALPIGLILGHRRRGSFVAVSVANMGRALPSFAILAIVFPFTIRYLPGTIGFAATLIALVLLAIPPLLANTVVGIQVVDEETVEAARGMGLSGRQVLMGLELPLAAPVIVAGVRTAAVQVVATATLAALVGWGGLGRFIIDGFAFGVRGSGGGLGPGAGMLVGGAILVALLAIATEVGFALIERAVTPRTTSHGHRSQIRRRVGQPGLPV